MNYSSSIRTRQIFRRLLVSWLIVAFVFTMIGVYIGYVITKNSYETIIQMQEEIIERGLNDD